MATCSSTSRRVAAARQPGTPVSGREFPGRDQWDPGAMPLWRGRPSTCAPAGDVLELLVDEAPLRGSPPARDRQRIGAVPRRKREIPYARSCQRPSRARRRCSAAHRGGPAAGEWDPTCPSKPSPEPCPGADPPGPSRTFVLITWAEMDTRSGGEDPLCGQRSGDLEHVDHVLERLVEAARLVMAGRPRTGGLPHVRLGRAWRRVHGWNRQDGQRPSYRSPCQERAPVAEGRTPV